MFWPVTSSARRDAHSAVVAALRPENVLLTWTPRRRSSPAFIRLRCSSANSHANSHSPVQGDGAVRAVGGAAGRPVGAGGRRLHRQQRVPDGGEPALDQPAVGVGQAAQVGDEHEQRLVVLAEQVVPRRGGRLGDLPERRVGTESELHGNGLGRPGSLDLEGAELVEDDLDLVGDPRQPPGLARKDQVLLLLGLEQQQVQELLLPPQQRRQVLVVHVSTALPSSRRAGRPCPLRICRRSSHRHVAGGAQAEAPKFALKLDRKSAEGGAEAVGSSREKGGGGGGGAWGTHGKKGGKPAPPRVYPPGFGKRPPPEKPPPAPPPQ